MTSVVINIQWPARLNVALMFLGIHSTVGVKAFCGNTVSQQEESGQASSPITLQTASPTIEVQAQAPTMEEPTPEPQTCEECFTQFLTAQQRTAFEDAINMDIEAQCQILEDSLVFNPLEFEVELEAVAHNLGLVGVDNETAGQIIECLERVFGFEPLEE